MSNHARYRLPISTRHAFALGFDLAVRRDSFHSLIVPLLLRSPWVLTLALLPPLDQTDRPRQVVLLSTAALLGDFFTLLVVGAMLRFRAQSVFNTPPGAKPAPASECYTKGFRRIPWLLVTEVVRNGALAFAASISILPAAFVRLPQAFAGEDIIRNLILLGVAFFLLLPGLFLSYRLAVATEAVVLDERDLAGAFQQSFRLMQGRFERWVELVFFSGLLVLAMALGMAALTLVVPALAGTTGLAVLWLAIVGITPIIQYAWTFFYLRLAEADQPGVEVGPAYALVPANGGAQESPPASPTIASHLELVPPRESSPEDPESGQRA